MLALHLHTALYTALQAAMIYRNRFLIESNLIRVGMWLILVMSEVALEAKGSIDLSLALIMISFLQLL